MTSLLMMEDKLLDMWTREDRGKQFRMDEDRETLKHKNISHSIEEILRRPTRIGKDERVYQHWSVVKENAQVHNQPSCTDFSQKRHEESSKSATESQKRKRQTRVTFTPFQVQELETVFQQTHYPDINTRDGLASRLQLTEGRIQVQHPAPGRVWFLFGFMKKKSMKSNNVHLIHTYTTAKGFRTTFSFNGFFFMFMTIYIVHRFSLKASKQ
ncbi:hypothetical protein ILYODFUR_017887 [Ilyodon furcidens]|uniref:Homeobox domain-containing protein n=1 Tax=Ilyodon furcidens TaxID=33524 RepID=A0ABV0SQL0_9TELE